jgi:rubrerythrin
MVRRSFMIELNNFYNNGFGWICRHCERELAAGSQSQSTHARFMTEGESENKQPEMSNRGLAKWADAAQRTLVCPRCGITELADIA